MPSDVFLTLLSSEDLHVKEESVVVGALSAYQTKREPLRPFLPDEDPSADPALLAQLTEEERKARDEARAARAAEAEKARKE